MAKSQASNPGKSSKPSSQLLSVKKSKKNAAVDSVDSEKENNLGPSKKRILIRWMFSNSAGGTVAKSMRNRGMSELKADFAWISQSKSTATSTSESTGNPPSKSGLNNPIVPSAVRLWSEGPYESHFNRAGYPANYVSSRFLKM
ncbi:hypothetical protein EDD16DRAFT_1710900 [Pisolithus croceorrhizus]|nr:hypothetical protein EDD16DRAFT_1710900 [Pisolithus croceorrhizus]